VREMSKKQPGVEYPRDFPLPDCMPAGWLASEMCYSEASAYFGKTYVRYRSADGKHKHIGNAKQAIILHARDNGLDENAMVEAYQSEVAEKKAMEAALRQEQQQDRGQLKGAAREAAIASFREEHGNLAGPIVFQFPGWITRWDFLPDCEQVRVTYKDTDGKEWMLLKDIECDLWHKIQTGSGEHLPSMIEEAKEKADRKKFAVGSATARETRGTCMIEGGKAGSEVKSGDRSDFIKEEKMRPEKIARIEEPVDKVKMRAVHKLREEVQCLRQEAAEQTGWAALKTLDDVQQSFVEFRRLLTASCFSNDTPLVAMFGLGEERHFARRIHGVYYKMPELIEGRDCFQKVLHLPMCTSGIGCDGLYILWDPASSKWHIATRPEAGAPSIARCGDPEQDFTKVKGVWDITGERGDFFADPDLKIVLPACADADS